jgi:23S rRNA (pseudouridine1915-N3)-methyltransferase
MELALYMIGKTDDAALDSLIQQYEKRLKHYIKNTVYVLPDLKNRKSLSQQEQKKAEGEKFLQQLQPSDHVVLLDENGKNFNSLEFSQWIEKKLHLGTKRCCLLIGGPYGFSSEVTARAQEKIALSTLTFTHQMVRLILMEQLYRAFTILKNENYHHQ